MISASKFLFRETWDANEKYSKHIIIDSQVTITLISSFLLCCKPLEGSFHLCDVHLCVSGNQPYASHIAIMGMIMESGSPTPLNPSEEKTNFDMMDEAMPQRCQPKVQNLGKCLQFAGVGSGYYFSSSTFQEVRSTAHL